MPGMVAFRRRWSVGSDDLVVPAVFLVILHTVWIMVLSLVRGLVHFETTQDCTKDLHFHILAYIGILGVCLVLEVIIAVVSLRGTILSPEPRCSMEYLLYVRLFFGLVELAWLIVGAVWSGNHYQTCKPEAAKKALLGIMVCNWVMMLSCVISVWCTYDTAGAKWVKMKKFQDSLKDRRRVNRRQSGSRRNWRQRKAFRAYEESWDRRLQLLCCCVERKGRNQSSMSEIAQLFTEFFRDLDVVPSDVVAGLVLLRHHQKQRMKMVVAQGTSGIYQYLSGVPITPNTRFLQLTQPEVMGEFIKVIHYMRYALAAYGWPVFVMMNPCTWLCRLLPVLSCCCCCSKGHPHSTIVDDNCCGCNFASLKRISGLHDLDIVYATYHVDIGETPFYVALDHEFGKVVVCVRGTLSLQDVLTDLKAEPETLPLQPPRDDWQGHKGMVQAALYIKKKLIDDKILEMAWERDEGRDVAKYDLVCVGHSLGAGTAAILAILLKNEYPTLHCYAFSPPGGLLTLPCVEETKSYITSVVIGKDVVPRIGLPQLEMLRTDIINLLKNSRKSKWNIISKGFCCCSNERFFDERNLYQERDVTAHPSNSQIGLSAHAPLYPPGKMIHVVRSHASEKKGGCNSSEPIYQALWASNADFDEVLVSPTMINDHMPDNVLESLEKVLLRIGPQKPIRTMTEAERQAFMSLCTPSASTTPSPSQAQGFLETSFTSDPPLHLQPSSGSDTNNVTKSWDYAAEQILQCSNHGGEVIVPDSYTKLSHQEVPRNPRNQQYFTLPLTSEPVQAPLASPETLSMASGILLGLAGHGHVDGNGHGHRNNMHHPQSNSPPKTTASRPYSSAHTAPSNMRSANANSVTDVDLPVTREVSKHRNRNSRNEKNKSKEENEHFKNQIDRENSVWKKEELHQGNGKGDGIVVSSFLQTSASQNSAHPNCNRNEGTPMPNRGTDTDMSLRTVLCHDSEQPSQSQNSISMTVSCPTESHPTCQKSNSKKFRDIKRMSETMNLPAVSSSKSESTISSTLMSGLNPGSAGDRGTTTIQTVAELPVSYETSHNLGVGKLSAAPEDYASGTATLNTCPRNSPVETTQGEYEHPNLYYSQASTGYPHGAYHPPIRYPVQAQLRAPFSSGCSSHLRHAAPTLTSIHPHRFVHCQSESSIFSKHLPPKLSMKRSAEQTDICHLIDETEIYDDEKDLFAIKRSAEQTDISHLQDDTDVFELEDILGELSTQQGRMSAVHSTSLSSTVGSPSTEDATSTRHASSSQSVHSNDIFESQGPMEVQGETDV
ncbi:sn1-specific diacylglycerol lipase alpha-like isoform X4 [Pomacea canaliculata]|uniref:sn1-specific diacylglycerol lipase alpha-like isoform X4 n=1 Tax=Pomacea canaliculata TaxID=400727 RepID=UPI000D7272D3|nr:sn1-specific diacylglycerol lipase alpha-like isoform X4 [Pomacea canaliculata]